MIHRIGRVLLIKSRRLRNTRRGSQSLLTTIQLPPTFSPLDRQCCRSSMFVPGMMSSNAADSIPLPRADEVTSIYPQPMLDLVYECLKATPYDRIRPDELCLRIREHVGTCPSLKYVPLKLPPDLLNGDYLRCKPEPYGLWARDHGV